MSYILRFKDGHGKWKASWKVLDKDGNKVSPDGPDLDFEKKESGYTIVVVAFHGHKVTEYGPYTLVFTVADKDYTFEYQIKAGDVER